MQTDDEDSLFGKLESLAEFDSHILHLIQMGKLDLGTSNTGSPRLPLDDDVPLLEISNPPLA
jgi:hypothetical protein